MLSRYNYGLFIINVKAGDVLTTKNLGYAATVAWKLGYINCMLRDSNERYGKINAFTDGWFCPLARDKKAMCEWLNNNPYGEEYRLMTKEEVIFLISNRQQGFL